MPSCFFGLGSKFDIGGDIRGDREGRESRSQSLRYSCPAGPPAGSAGTSELYKDFIEFYKDSIKTL